MYKAVSEEIIYDITIENDIIYEDNTNVKISIINFDENTRYKIVININGKQILEDEIKEKENVLNFKLLEGSNDVKIALYKNEEEKVVLNKTIYYIEPYKKQFLDELSNNGVSTHFGHHTYIDDVDLSIDLLKALGVKYIRDDIRWEIINKDGYTILDHWINRIHDSEIKILGILGFPDKNSLGNDYRISNENELKKYNSYVEEIVKRYNFIESYEIWNEPNSAWKKEEDFYWYTRMCKDTHNIVKDINSKANIIIGSAMTPEKDTSNGITAQKFFTSIFNTNIYNNAKDISYHQYDKSYTRKYMKNMQKSIENTINSIGGFMRTNITENGLETKQSNCEEKERAEEIVKQSITENIISNMYIYYCWRDMEEKESYLNYGLINYNYTPKPAYYAMKNFLTNTNGAEYIGNLDTTEEIEAYAYDKDGKPVIIAWSNNNDKNIEIDYKNFTAKDIYGKEIKPNENGKLPITASPVYIYNLDNKYYYKAISNTALQKYNEFEQKFQTEILNVTGLQPKIDSLKQYIKQIESKTTESENIAKQKMKEHFELGNTILSAYQKGELNIEYVKLSSMLDLLNDIGNSYEDLVTVSAKTRNPNLSETKTIINDAEKNINTNADLEIIYPQKILEFSKDLYEKAEYINSLEEENDIKTGLIISSDLHAKYLAQWSKEFTDIYIEDYIKNNPITEKYSTKEITNQDVTVTLNILPDTKITNNKNSNIYTFTQNGEFIFEYQRRGRNFTKTVKVENIDKIAPQIINIKNEAKYTETIIPKIEEENLEKVTLTKNEEEIEYILGKKIEEEGKYKLTVTDKAGNISEVNFEILKYQEDSYIIDKDKIRNIKNNTTKEYFTEKLNMPGKYKILHNKEELETEDIVSSGDILQLEDGKTYTLIVAGDINQDGKVTAYDLSMLRKTILNVKELNEVEKLAADVNCDNNKIGAKDYSSMKLIILGK